MACGDCDLLNFGGLATPERRLAFDINDFDEVSVAPWEWDVARLAASFVIAGRANGFDAPDCREAARAAARSYRGHMARYADLPVLDAYYETIDLKRLVLAGADEEMMRLNLKRIRKAQQESAHLKEYTKLTVESGGQPRIRDEPPLVFHDTDMERQAGYRAMVEAMLAQYVATLPPERRLLVERYRPADLRARGRASAVVNSPPRWPVPERRPKPPRQALPPARRLPMLRPPSPDPAAHRCPPGSTPPASAPRPTRSRPSPPGSTCSGARCSCAAGSTATSPTSSGCR